MGGKGFGLYKIPENLDTTFTAVEAARLHVVYIGAISIMDDEPARIRGLWYPLT